MEDLRRQRAPIRRGFTKAVKTLEEELENEHKTRISVQQMYNRAIYQRDQLNNLDRKMDLALLEAQASEEEMTEEYDAVTEFVNRFSDVDVRVREYFDLLACGTEYDVQSSQRNCNQKNQYRLPKLEFKKFSGEAKDWLGFWSQFRQIDNNASLAPEDKFQYLIQSTVEGSKARDVVESFPPSSENYPKVITYFKERFGKEEILLEVYVRELLKLVLKNAMHGNDNSSISTLYDRLETQLRALDTLGVTSDKFAAMLYPLVESCLPEDVLRAWERNRGQEYEHPETKKDRLSLLMEFLKREVDGEVRISMARTGFGVDSTDMKRIKPKYKHKVADEIPTATELFSGQQTLPKIACIFCDKVHPSQDCFKAPKLSLDEKRKIMQDKKACFVCLKPGHISKKCRANVRCPVCEKKHYIALCPDIPKNKVEGEKKPIVDGTVSMLSNPSCSSTVMLQTLLVRVKGSHRHCIVRALMDTGSQKSYLSKRAAHVLGVKPEGAIEIAHNLFGGESTPAKRHHVLKIDVESLDNSYRCSMSVLDQSVICGGIPPVDESVLRELALVGVKLSDHGPGQPDINLLLGADVAGKLLTGKIHQTRAGPTAVETRLGWTVMGSLLSNIHMSDSSALVSSMLSTDAEISDLWNLDAIGIMDMAMTQSRQDLEQAAMDYFQKSTTRLPDGRFEVSLPWIEGHPALPSHEDMSLRRLLSATRKLESLGRFDDYQKVFDDWLVNGIIEEVPKHETDNSGHYLPHRAVIKESSETTKIRPVFDASAKMKGGTSLNDCLEKGRNLLELIPKIILGFRLNQIGLTSDVEKAFLQISVKREERDFLRFLWWEKGTKIVKKYRHCRVVFGVSSSPFLLAASLKTLLENVPEDLVDFAKHLLTSLYVDNCVTSLTSMSEVQHFIRKAMNMMSAAKFNLRGWLWNDDTQPEKTIPVLGLLWNVKKDVISLDLRDISADDMERTTKRKVLSFAHKLFDPIGFSSPVALYPKILLQEAWKLKIGWDTALPEELSTRFSHWRSELLLLKEVSIPRWVFERVSDKNGWSLHTFTDASKHAYAAAVFIRAESEIGVSVQLLQAKSRVSPVKQVTIPRIELLGCCIGARLTNSVKSDLDFPDVPCFYWTDSSNALYWIQRHDNWSTFVGNRVKEIRELTNTESWRHVQGTLNPADLPSRGCSAKQLLKSKWWEGPEWLRKPPALWPRSEVMEQQEVIGAERKKTVASYLVIKADVPWYARYFSKYTKIVRMLAWIHRYRHNCANKTERQVGDLSNHELARGELWLVRMVQADEFSNCKSPAFSILKQLKANQDENGIWRVQTRIFMRRDSNLFRSPMLLPSTNKIVHLLIQKIHEELSHGGIQVVMSTIRERFWLTRARKTIKEVIQKCKKCLRFSASKLEAIPAPLPIDRVRDAAVFEVVGIDLAGPLYLKDRPKAWVVLYTCAVYRAVHFELVSSLSTESFLQSLRRFISRRGRPCTIYSDNGTNFIGTANLWKNVDWERIRKSEYGSSHVIQPITWVFNPPSAPWWGGWWERIVRMLKQVLRKVLGRACLDFEEMMTVLCDSEAVVNSRPLTYISDDIDDFIPLTPSMFLQEIREVGIPDMDSIDAETLNKRVKYRQKVRQHFRVRFRSEYLGMLMPIKKIRGVDEAIKPGDVVLVGSDNSKRVNWPMARVLEVFPGKDGVIRVAKVKTLTGEIVRPIQRLYPFEVSKEEREILVAEPEVDKELPSGLESDDVTPPVKMSRFGRKIKPPKRI